MNGALVIAINRIFNTVGRIEQERCGLGIVTMAIRDLASPLEQGLYFFFYL